MRENSNNLRIQQDKDNHFKSEYYLFREYLRNNTHTCTMACDALGIPQKNATRYKRTLEAAGILMEVCVTYCKSTGCLAAYLTSNEVLIKSLTKDRERQLSLAL